MRLEILWMALARSWNFHISEKCFQLFLFSMFISYSFHVWKNASCKLVNWELGRTSSWNFSEVHCFEKLSLWSKKWKDLGWLKKVCCLKLDLCTESSYCPHHLWTSWLIWKVCSNVLWSKTIVQLNIMIDLKSCVCSNVPKTLTFIQGPRHPGIALQSIIIIVIIKTITTILSEKIGNLDTCFPPFSWSKKRKNSIRKSAGNMEVCKIG